MSTKKVDLNIKELKDFLKHIIENNRFLQKTKRVPVTVNVEGEAGIGKTSTIIQLAKEMNLDCVRLNLAELEELGDLIGFPLRQFQLCKEETVEQSVTEQRTVMIGDKPEIRNVTVKKPVVTTECLWIDEPAVEEYVKRGYEFTGENRMIHCPPDWAVGIKEGTLVILDDYSRADPRFIQACMTLIETQKHISWELPKDCHIILTTNPDNGDYHVSTMDVAQKTRFISVDLKFDVDCWAEWADAENIDGRCINFLLLHPELVKEEVNARAITTFFNSISSIEVFSDPKSLSLIQMIGEGSVGVEFAALFTAFINEKLDKIIAPDKVLLHDNEGYILGEIRSCIGKDLTYRADIASTFITRISNFALRYADEGNPVTQAVIERLIRLATEKDLFDDDLRYIFVRKIYNGNMQKFKKIMSNMEVMDMTLR